MAPKKGTKMSLADFLTDETTGSWADEMDALPTAPSFKADGDRGRRGPDDFTRDLGRDRNYSSREELPMPTKPPYTAFLGNLAYDLTETDIEEFFAPHKLKSVKIIRERDEKPKGFGYVEFEDLDGLKEGLVRSGQSLSNRVVRVSVAEPQKERSFGSNGGPDDDKFEKAWRRDGPLPDLDRSSSRPRSSRFGGAEPGTTNEADDWRSVARPPRPPMERDNSSRRGSGFSTPESVNEGDWRGSRPPRSNLPEREGPPRRQFTPRESTAVDAEETWSMGSKFKPSNSPPPSESGFGSRRPSRDQGPSRQHSGDEEPSDWRSGARRGPPPPRQGGFGDRSPLSGSTPPTPMSRRKLELLPRTSNSPSQQSSPLTSPQPNSATLPSVKSNPFGDAKPIDVSAREKEIEEKLAKHDPIHYTTHHHPQGAPVAQDEAPPQPLPPRQESWREKREGRFTPSHSRQPSGNVPGSRDLSHNASRAVTPPKEGATKVATTPPTPESPSRFTPNNVRPTFSFAAAAASIAIDEEGPEAGAGAQEDTNALGLKEAVVDEVAAREPGLPNGKSHGTEDVDHIASTVADLTVSDKEAAVGEGIAQTATLGGVHADEDDVSGVMESIVEEADDADTAESPVKDAVHSVAATGAVNASSEDVDTVAHKVNVESA